MQILSAKTFGPYDVSRKKASKIAKLRYNENSYKKQVKMSKKQAQITQKAEKMDDFKSKIA